MGIGSGGSGRQLEQGCQQRPWEMENRRGTISGDDLVATENQKQGSTWPLTESEAGVCRAVDRKPGGSGFSSSPGVFESQVCPTIVVLYYIDSTFELQRAGMHTSFMGLTQQSM